MRLELEAPYDWDMGFHHINCTYLTSGDLKRLTTCCAGGALQQLALHSIDGAASDEEEDLYNPRDTSPDYGVLRRLSSLTKLTICGGDGTDGLWRLTQLHELSVAHTPFDGADLVGVTSFLCCLTRLSLRSVNSYNQLVCPLTCITWTHTPPHAHGEVELCCPARLASMASQACVSASSWACSPLVGGAAWSTVCNTGSGLIGWHAWATPHQTRGRRRRSGRGG